MQLNGAMIVSGLTVVYNNLVTIIVVKLVVTIIVLYNDLAFIVVRDQFDHILTSLHSAALVPPDLVPRASRSCFSGHSSLTL